jgi:hypothetical protein
VSQVAIPTAGPCLATAEMPVFGARTATISGRRDDMGEVIRVNLADVKYSANVQGVLSKRIQAKLEQMSPERWSRADRIAAQAVADMRGFDRRVEFTLNLERPVDAQGAFSEKAFQAAAEKLKAEVDALVHELRKAAHLAIAGVTYSTVINLVAPDEMLTEGASAASASARRG